MKLLMVLILSVVLIAGCTSQQPTASENMGANTIEITSSKMVNLEFFTKTGSVMVASEIADTPEKQEKGLMLRESLGENDGMLFVFSDEQPRTFWMKNTKIPLDIIFFSAGGFVVDIKKGFEPCTIELCPTYTSKQPAKFAVEVNSGFADKNEIIEGQFVAMPAI